jgi:hypothetical protein
MGKTLRMLWQTVQHALGMLDNGCIAGETVTKVWVEKSEAYYQEERAARIREQLIAQELEAKATKALRGNK